MRRTIPFLGVLVVRARDDAAYASRFGRALEHMGFCVEEMDTGSGALSAANLGRCSVLVLAGEHLGAGLDPKDAAGVSRAVEQGMGLVNFDPFVSEMPTQAGNLLGIRRVQGVFESDTVRVADNTHYVTAGLQPGEQVASGRSYGAVKSTTLGDVLVTDRSKNPLVTINKPGRGRTVSWHVLPSIWDADVLGHGYGLDGLFFRSIVWAARKPIAALAWPPYVTVRVDDVNGKGSRLRWCRRLVDAGFHVNLGLLLDEIDDEAAGVLRDLAATGRVDCSPHAFSGSERIFAADEGGEKAESRLARMDAALARIGVRPARLLNPDYDEVDEDVLGLLADRGITGVMSPLRPGEKWDGRGRPSGYPYGCANVMYDEMKAGSGVFALSCGAEPVRRVMEETLGREGISSLYYFDPVVDSTRAAKTWGGAAMKNDVDGAAERAIGQMNSGFENVYCARLTTHEAALEAFSEAELDRFVELVSNWVRAADGLHAGGDDILDYAKSLRGVRMTRAEASRERRVSVTLEGASGCDLQVSVFKGRGDVPGGIVRTFHRVRPVSGRADIEFGV
ncbi:MAG: hypothetical protein JW909_10765 [Planctomycetes bacterium]|nr:hypothetical protein [Planctomycetota bacterium]